MKRKSFGPKSRSNIDWGEKNPKKYDPVEDPNVQPGQDNPRNPQDDESTKKSLRL